MNFIDLDKKEIKSKSVILDDFYEYTIGNPIEVTCIKSDNVNKLISKNLSSKFIEDKFMLKYRPNNKIYFDRTFIDSPSDSTFTSYEINNKVYIGEGNKYKLNDGVLAFSGFLSANNMVEEDRFIFGNSRVLETIKQKVFILAIGVRNDMLFALYYIMSSKGTALSLKDDANRGISVNTLKYCDCSNYSKFSIKDWFNGAKITEI